MESRERKIVLLLFFSLGWYVLGNYGLLTFRLHLHNISSPHGLDFLLQIITQTFFSSQLDCYNRVLVSLTAT